MIDTWLVDAERSLDDTPEQFREFLEATDWRTVIGTIGSLIKAKHASDKVAAELAKKVAESKRPKVKPKVTKAVLDEKAPQYRWDVEFPQFAPTSERIRGYYGTARVATDATPRVRSIPTNYIDDGSDTEYLNRDLWSRWRAVIDGTPDPGTRNVHVDTIPNTPGEDIDATRYHGRPFTGVDRANPVGESISMNGIGPRTFHAPIEEVPDISSRETPW